MNESSLLSSEEVAEKLAMSVKTVQKYAKNGVLQAVPTLMGKREVLRFTQETVDNYLRKQQQRLEQLG